ncbi:DUF2057 family protein [Enterovibrio norvegicus]|uniref:UPF0319 protein SAMN03084138_03566 n=1 Tax=Enterovibrio norvegicus DSM 15893 TaxID=1121869 RepID=A0A1I5UEE8_9GAMM|nr:DUF2057 family protein [Enterovibrio norvegicus]SFP93599.1 hypothetical protein SAMN03084138_03566 [Enterovibrio norvegicus DSM 15893]
MRKPILASLFAMMLPVSAHADVTLHLNNNVELLAFNGQAHKGTVFGTEEPIVLENGTQQIAFRYVASIEEGKDVTFVKSDVIVAKFDADDEEIHFDFPDVRTTKQAREFRKNPEFQLLDGSDSVMPFAKGTLEKNGFQLSRDYVSELQRFNQTTEPASLQLSATQVVAPVPTVRSGKVVVVDSVGKNEEEYQLHYWYQKADQETKNRFRAFINAN